MLGTGYGGFLGTKYYSSGVYLMTDRKGQHFLGIHVDMTALACWTNCLGQIWKLLCNIFALFSQNMKNIFFLQYFCIAHYIMINICKCCSRVPNVSFL